MNILLLAPWLPWPPHDGARIRILETVRFLSGRHRVVLVAPTYSAGERDLASRLESGGIDVHAVPVPDGGLARLGRLCKGVLSGKPPIQAFHRNSAVARQISKLTTAIAFDIVQIEFSFLSHYLQAVRGSSRPRTILSMHNVESLRFERELQFSAWNARRLVVLADRYLFPKWEPRAVQSFDGVVAVSEAEAAWISHHAPRVQVKIVPNGVDVDFFRPQSAAGTSSNVVFTGSMDYPPNIDAALWFADAILPIARQSTTAASFCRCGSSTAARNSGSGHSPRNPGHGRGGRHPPVSRRRPGYGRTAAVWRGHAAQDPSGDGNGAPHRIYDTRRGRSQRHAWGASLARR